MSISPWLLAAGSGILLFTASPPLDQGWVAWVALVPLLIAIRGRRPAVAILLGWIAGIVECLTTTNWVVGTLDRFTRLGLAEACVAHLLMALVLGGFVGLFAGGAVMTRPGRLSAFVLVPAWWLLAEELRGWLFPWAPLGVTQHRASIVQLAEIVGVPGLSALVVLGNLALAEWLPDRRRWRPGVVTACIIGAGFAWGQARAGLIQALPPTGQVRMGIVQTAEPQERKWHPRHRAAAAEQLLALTKTMESSHPEVIVWPESATLFAFEEDVVGRQEIARTITKVGAPLIFGSPAADRPRPNQVQRRNGSDAVSPLPRARWGAVGAGEPSMDAGGVGALRAGLWQTGVPQSPIPIGSTFSTTRFRTGNLGFAAPSVPWDSPVRH